MKEQIKRWLKQAFCDHTPIKTSDEEYKSTGYLFKCGSCGRFLRWSIECNMLCDYRFWVGASCGILTLCLIVHILFLIIKQ